MSNSIVEYNGPSDMSIKWAANKLDYYLSVRDLMNSMMWNFMNSSTRAETFDNKTHDSDVSQYIKHGDWNMLFMQTLGQTPWFAQKTNTKKFAKYSIPLNGFVVHSNYQSTVNSTILDPLIKSDLEIVLSIIISHCKGHRSLFFTCKELYYYIDIYYRHYRVKQPYYIYSAVINKVYRIISKTKSHGSFLWTSYQVDTLPLNLTHLKIRNCSSYVIEKLLTFPSLRNNLLSLNINSNFDLSLDKLSTFVNLRKIKVNCGNSFGYKRSSITFPASLEYLTLGDVCDYEFELPPKLVHFNYLSRHPFPVTLPNTLKHLYLSGAYLNCGKSLIDTLKPATNLETVYVDYMFDNDSVIEIKKILPPQTKFKYLTIRYKKYCPVIMGMDLYPSSIPYFAITKPFAFESNELPSDVEKKDVKHSIPKRLNIDKNIKFSINKPYYPPKKDLHVKYHNKKVNRKHTINQPRRR